MSTELEIAREALLDERRRAERMVSRGLLMIGIVPVAIFAATMLGIWLEALAPFVLAALYTVIGGITGVVLIGVGALGLGRTKRELRELEASRLPSARLLT